MLLGVGDRHAIDRLRKVAEAGITLRRVRGTEATEADWRFFKRCYDRTYSAHYSTPYLNLDFFLRIAATMPANLLLVIADVEGKGVSSALVMSTDIAVVVKGTGTN